MNEILWLLKWMVLVLAFFMLTFDTIIVISVMCMALMNEERSVIFMESLESILGCN